LLLNILTIKNKIEFNTDINADRFQYGIAD
jgi:hypothetical protein